MFSSDLDKLAFHLSRRDGIPIDRALLHVSNFAQTGLSAEGVAERLGMAIEHAKRTVDEIPAEVAATIELKKKKKKRVNENESDSDAPDSEPVSGSSTEESGGSGTEE